MYNPDVYYVIKIEEALEVLNRILGNNVSLASIGLIITSRSDDHR